MLINYEKNIKKLKQSTDNQKILEALQLLENANGMLTDNDMKTFNGSESKSKKIEEEIYLGN